jgi:hypothetical protein
VAQNLHIETACCASFIVSRSRILAHPKDMYVTMARWLHSTVRL